MSKIPVFISFDNGNASGIYHSVLDTLKGRLSEPSLYYEGEAVRSLHYHHYELALAHGHGAGMTRLDTHASTPFVSEVMHSAKPAAFVLAERFSLYSVSDEGDRVEVYRKQGTQTSFERQLSLGEAQCDSLYLYRDYLYIPCPNLDCVRIYHISAAFQLIKELSFPKGSGPCRLTMDEEGRYLYVLCQFSKELFVYRISAPQRLHCEQIIKVLPAGFQKEAQATAISLSPNGKFLYTACAGADIITCFARINGNLEQREYIQSGGKKVSSFVIDETGRWMIVLNRNSDLVVVFQLNPDCGEALMITDEKKIPSPNALTLAYRIS
ncbi:MAG: lactonase family protein [Erysipelotrichaceae bacterium]|nr:lactonase family protein [Erysipelotrichaceae bacterium]